MHAAIGNSAPSSLLPSLSPIAIQRLRDALALSGILASAVAMAATLWFAAAAPGLATAKASSLSARAATSAPYAAPRRAG